MVIWQDQLLNKIKHKKPHQSEFLPPLDENRLVVRYRVPKIGSWMTL